jgi:hypothetical protein
MYNPYAKPVKWRSRKYREFISEFPCAREGCGKVGPSDPAHHGPDSGTSTKASDVYLIPLCHDCHTLYHGTGKLDGIDYKLKQLYYLNLYLSKENVK